MHTDNRVDLRVVRAVAYELRCKICNYTRVFQIIVPAVSLVFSPNLLLR